MMGGPWKRVCLVPGCRRSVTHWARNNKQGRKPHIFQTNTPKAMQLFRERFPEVKLRKEVCVCDIHFTVHDFFPRYRTYTGDARPPPEHLRCAGKHTRAVPSLYLDLAEIQEAQRRAEQAGEHDWWKLADSYDEKLDLVNLLEFNKADISVQSQSHDVGAVLSGSPVLEEYVMSSSQDVAPNFFCSTSESEACGFTFVECPQSLRPVEKSHVVDVWCDEVLSDSSPDTSNSFANN